MNMDFNVRRMKNQLVKHYLIHWYELDENIEYLSSAEEVKIKILYSSLKELNDDEVEFLAEKYHHRTRLSDEVITNIKGVDFQSYRDQRIRIETKLEKFIKKYRKEFDNEFRLAMDMQYG